MPNTRLKDLSGQAFGEWKVLTKAGNTKGGQALWRCECVCGSTKNVRGADLRNGKSRECGHSKPARTAKLRSTHQQSGSRLYQCWQNMMARCCRDGVNSKYYKDKGITVCDHWSTFDGFRQWADISGYEDSLTIERLDNSKGYFPENCMWIPKADQPLNRTNVDYAPDGELWWHKAKRAGITRAAFEWRKAQEWAWEEIVSRPLGKREKFGPRDEYGRFTSSSCPVR